MAPTLDSPKRLDALSAVNFMLDKYGERKVSHLGETTSAVKAESLLATTSVDVQSGGWNFCTDLGVTMEPLLDGRIPVPADVLEVNPSMSSLGRNLVPRGDYLFDRDKGSAVFDGPIIADLVRAHPFEDLPQSARWYITLLATVSFLVSEKPDDPSLRSLREMLSAAKASLEQYDNRIGQAPLPFTNPHFRRHRGNR